MAAASAIWGEEVFNGILYGVTRKTKLLSFLGPLQEIVGDVKIVRWLKEYNAYLVICGVGVAFLCTWKAGRNWLEAAVLGYLVMLTLYKVGHQQFYIPWLFMVGSLPLVNKRSADRIAIILLPAVLSEQASRGSNGNHFLGGCRSAVALSVRLRVCFERL